MSVLFKCLCHLIWSYIIISQWFKHQACGQQIKDRNRLGAFAQISRSECLKIITFIPNCIFFAQLTLVFLIHHAIYRNQILFCGFERLFQGVVSDLKCERENHVGKIYKKWHEQLIFNWLYPCLHTQLIQKMIYMYNTHPTIAK